jgi:phage gp45-like
MPLGARDKLREVLTDAATAIYRISFVSRVVESGLAFLQAYGHGDPDDAANQELLQEEDLEHMQHFGFESFPAGDGDTEGIVVGADGGEACIAERRVLPTTLAALVAGESRTYGEDGQSILHKTGGDIEAEPKSGQHVKLGSGATKDLGLDGDTVDRTTAPPDSMTAWMTLVEGVCNTVAPGTFTGVNNALSFSDNGTLTASATKVKGE